MKTIICVIGRTCSGKDTLARALKKKFGFDTFVSYTTREKRDSEVDGVEHKFITEEEYDNIYKYKEKIAYTEINGYKYFVLKEDLINSKDEYKVYIIDPKGFEELVRNFKNDDNIKIFSIYTKCNKTIRRRRYNKRESNHKVSFEKRDRAETKQFDVFESIGSTLYSTGKHSIISTEGLDWSDLL